MTAETDEDAWLTCHPADRWLFDKLLLSMHFGYLCGPCGVGVPESRNYVVRPIMNLSGMGAGASIRFMERDSVVEPGYFWCEVFHGPHISVDYRGGLPVLAVEGLRETHAPLYRWREWRPAEPLPWPNIPLAKAYPVVNVEFIGGQPIEIHLRGNPDPMGLVCWETDAVLPTDLLVADPENADGFLPERRLGFLRARA